MSNNSTVGISTLGLLGVLFIGLKLCGVIDWSWGWVLCPFWIGLALLLAFIGVVIIGLVALGIGEGFDWCINKIRGK